MDNLHISVTLTESFQMSTEQLIEQKPITPYSY